LERDKGVGLRTASKHGTINNIPPIRPICLAILVHP
jgi:hypothetical protein